MINLIVSVFGALLVIGGFYFMYLGFNIPPNPIAFFVGLIASVFGLILVIIFGSRISLSKGATPKQKMAKPPRSAVTAPIRPKKMPVKDRKPSKPAPEPRAIKPKPRHKDEPKFGPTSTPPIKKEKDTSAGKAITPKKTITPKKKVETPSKSDEKIPSTEKTITLPPDLATKPKSPPKKIAPVKKATSDKAPEKPVIKKEDKAEPPQVKPFKIKEKTDEKVVPVPKSVLETADKERLKELQTRTGRDDQFVKNRLDKLKENYIQNAKDIESIIDERLDSFKGTIDKIKSDSTEPSIIWSFEAQDVQEAMKDTIVAAQSKLLMMYPWVRNIDVGILKKFMDTESRMIIQEASLDDDASVELIKLLQDKNVKIRTMPHVHTVAIVADETNGLIISTDPIYESYEVGVIYKDKKSIMEIERMFEDAWGISQDIDMELKK